MCHTDGRGIAGVGCHCSDLFSPVSKELSDCKLFSLMVINLLHYIHFFYVMLQRLKPPLSQADTEYMTLRDCEE